jgi:hypothetical protein
MLTLAPTLSATPNREVIPDFIKSSVQQQTAGDTAKFSRILGVTKSSLWGWQYGGILPTLNHMLNICRIMEVSPVEVIQGKSPAQKTWGAVAVPTQKTARSERTFDHIKCRALLETVLARNDDAPPSMRSVAKSLHYDQRTLYKNFPSLCKQISARFTAHKKSLQLLKVKGLQEEVRQAVYRLHIEGIYPSHRRVSNLLARPGALRRPEERMARVDAIHELELAERTL